MGSLTSAEAASLLPLVAVLLPMAGAPLVYWFLATHKRHPGLVLLMVSLGPLAALAGVVKPVVSGTRILSHIPALPDFSLHLSVDGLGLAFALMAAVIWPVITLYALSTGYPQAGRARFFTTSLITFGATVGVFLAGDVLSFFLFFELMTFSAYILLVHRRNRATLFLSNIYLYIGVAGGLALFMGLVLVWHITGTTALVPFLPAVLSSGTSPYLLVALFLLGFGGKAGVLGLHVWLPSTYVRSPFPATAMFSAVMSKAGIYGMLRFIALNMGDGQVTPVTMNMAWMVLWPGLATMIAGALMAIKAHSVKRLLAFSSMSQMGYMVVGVSMVIILGEKAPPAVAGTVLQAINHALFKTVLFLLAGSLAITTRSYTWRAFRGLTLGWAALPLAVAGLGVAGLPGLSGFVSKCLLHEALEDAYYMYHLTQLHYAEYLFLLGCGLTAAYYFKYLSAAFWHRPPGWLDHESDNARRSGIPEHFDPPPSVPERSRLAPAWVAPAILGLLSAAAVVLGLRPGLLVEGIGLVGAAPWDFPIAEVTHLTEVRFFGAHALKASAKALGLGVVLYGVYALALCRVAVPAWMSLERIAVSGIVATHIWLKRALRFEYLSMATYFTAAEDDADEQDELDGGERAAEGDDEWDTEIIRIPRTRVPRWLTVLTGPGMAERLTSFLGRGGQPSPEMQGGDESDPGGAEGETGDYEADMIQLPEVFRRRLDAEDRPGFSPRAVRRSARVVARVTRRIEGSLRSLGSRWQQLLEHLPLPDFVAINTRNLNFAALMLALLSTLTLLYLVSRTRMGP